MKDYAQQNTFRMMIERRIGRLGKDHPFQEGVHTQADHQRHYFCRMKMGLMVGGPYMNMAVLNTPAEKGKDQLKEKSSEDKNPDEHRVGKITVYFGKDVDNGNGEKVGPGQHENVSETHLAH